MTNQLSSTFTTSEAVAILADEFGFDAEFLTGRLEGRPDGLGWTDAEIAAYGEALSAEMEG